MTRAKYNQNTNRSSSNYIQHSPTSAGTIDIRLKLNQYWWINAENWFIIIIAITTTTTHV